MRFVLALSLIVWWFQALLGSIDSAVAQTTDDDDLYLLTLPVIIVGARNASNRGPSVPNDPTPPTGERPGPSNTGPKGALVSTSESITVRDDGAVIENLDIDGCITVRANNVTIRNTRINCSSFYAIRIHSGFQGLLVEDVEMFGMKSAGILGSNFIVRRANVHDAGADAFKPGSNVLIEASWMHRLGTIANSHSDAVQMVSGGDLVFRGNFVDMPNISGFTNSQCLIIQTNNGPIDDILIENNWLNGGGWCVQINDKGRGHGSPQNVRILNNRFGPDCQFGTIRVSGSDSDTTISGNIFELTGREIGVDEPASSCGNDFD